MTARIDDVTEMDSLGRVVAEVLAGIEPKADGRATVIALSGNLGAGKTTFTQLLAEALGVAEPVTSPTFVIMKKYETKDTRFDVLVHIDAYRLEGEEELRILGFKDELDRKENLIVIEWPEKVAGLIPDEAIRVELSLEGGKRRLQIK